MEPFDFKTLTNYLNKYNIYVKSNIKENILFNNISSLDESNIDDLTFFHNIKYLNYLNTTKAKACLITEEYSSLLNKKCIPIIVDDPYLAYAYITNLLFPSYISNGKINIKANINNDVKVGKNVQINANVVIKSNCIIDDDVVIYENTVIGPDVKIGKGTIILSGAIISNTNIGKKCLIQSGAVVGGKGFGFTPKQKIEITQKIQTT